MTARPPLRRIFVGALLSLSLLAFATAPGAARRHRAPAASASSAPPVPGGISSSSPTPAPADLIPALQAQLKATPGDKTVALRLAEAYLQVNHPDLAEEICAHLIAGGLKNAQVFFFNGTALHELGRYPEAIASLEAASNLDPTSPLVLLELTNAYLQANRVDDAIRVAKRADTFNDKDPRVVLNYGVVLAVRKEFDAARAQFAIAQTLSPNDPLPQILAARTYLDQNQADKAGALYDAILQKNSASEPALQGKVRIALLERRPDEAIALEERLFAGASEDAKRAAILNDEARIELDEKRQDKAEATVRREVTLFPNLEVAQIAMGDLALAEKKEYDAVTHWKAALGPKQDGKIALSRLGLYALRKNDPQGASKMFGRLTQVDPNDDAAWFHLGQSDQLLDRFDRARDAFRHAFTLRQTVQAFADIGSCDYELHRYQEAAHIFDQLIAQAAPFVNRNPNLLFIVAKAYDGANEKSKARTAYYRVLGFVKPGSSDEKTVRRLISGLHKH
jgi:tetratricopeptide (TPR) repeat protein